MSFLRSLFTSLYGSRFLLKQLVVRFFCDVSHPVAVVVVPKAVDADPDGRERMVPPQKIERQDIVYLYVYDNADRFTRMAEEKAREERKKNNL